MPRTPWPHFGILMVAVSMAICAAIPDFAHAETCGGVAARLVWVMRCYDGDTCTLSDKTKVRLAGIDAPKKKGTLGRKSGSGPRGISTATQGQSAKLRTLNPLGADWRECSQKGVLQYSSHGTASETHQNEINRQTDFCALPKLHPNENQ